MPPQKNTRDQAKNQELLLDFRTALNLGSLDFADKIWTVQFVCIITLLRLWSFKAASDLRSILQYFFWINCIEIEIIHSNWKKVNSASKKFSVKFLIHKNGYIHPNWMIYQWKDQAIMAKPLVWFIQNKM